MSFVLKFITKNKVTVEKKSWFFKLLKHSPIKIKMIAQSCGVRTLCTYSIANVPYHELCMRACISTTTVCWQSLQSPMASPRHWCMIWRSHKRWRWLEPQPGQNGEYLHLRLRKLGKVFVQHWTYYGWQCHKSKVLRITAISYKYGDQTAAAVATKLTKS